MLSEDWGGNGNLHEFTKGNFLPPERTNVSRFKQQGKDSYRCKLGCDAWTKQINEQLNNEQEMNEEQKRWMNEGRQVSY